MPTTVDLTDKPLTLSPEFVYQVVEGSDPVYAAAFQGPHEMNEEQTLKPGDVLDSVNALTVFSLGEARLNQFSQGETVPKEEKKAEGKKTKSA